MTETYMPFDGGPGANMGEPGWQSIFRKLLSTGPFPGYLGDLAPTANGSALAVSVAAGGGWVEGFFYNSDAARQLAITAADAGKPRIDRVVMTLDRTANTVTTRVLTGVAAAAPNPPALTQTDLLWDCLLADVAVPAAAGVIVAGGVTDRRVWAKGGSGVFKTLPGGHGWEVRAPDDTVVAYCDGQGTATVNALSAQSIVVNGPGGLTVTAGAIFGAPVAMPNNAAGSSQIAKDNSGNNFIGVPGSIFPTKQCYYILTLTDQFNNERPVNVTSWGTGVVFLSDGTHSAQDAAGNVLPVGTTVNWRRYSVG